jgi:hypothetical protein
MRIEQYYMKHGDFKGHQETESENEDLASGAGHFIASRDLATVFNRKNTVYEIGERIASTFGHVDPTIIKATRHSLADIENMGMGAAGSRTVTVNQETWEQGVTIDVAYDLDTWEHTPTSYLVKPSIPLSTILEVGAMHHRRQGFKNLFIKQ